MSTPKGNFLDIHFVSQALDHIKQGIHVVDVNGRTILYNETMRIMESMEDIDILDKRLLDVFKFHPDENSTLLHALAAKEPILNVKQTYFNALGQEITTLNNTYPLWQNGEVTGAIEIARDVSTMEKMMTQTNTGTSQLSSFDHWTGTSPLIIEMIFEGKKASLTNSMILLTGEGGSGKERLGRSIHLERGLRPDAFYSIDCRSLSAERLDELLTRYVSGFNEESLFTLFIDHLESLDYELQKKLTKQLIKWKADSRTATGPAYYPILTLSEDPIDAIQSGNLDKDLYYTMSEVTIFVPSLRDRKEDIGELADFFINHFNTRFQTGIKGITSGVIELFSSYDWPGNVRELEHVMEASMFAMSHQDTLLSYSHLPHYFRLKFDDPSSTPLLDSSAFMLHEGKAIQTLDAFLQEAESYYIQKSLQYHNFNITKTADALGMSRQNLQYRLKKNNLIRQKKSGSPK
ncbi:AAA family ATPase [Jeotgalibacillus sp. S-D1]|uniref:sigma 54-interacting transcriptional regulator n=1 Tax=Jeotgalibacillus sp. S-D1 TaxID=2552189 RepID=UPI00105A4D52|nr:sigma 54-interacting transcriptional regulator [Jeotgalibacillus sp. S-D1]TDL30357.1 AAA family ATPase [Jeotgalibacillus sp. S-D1]